MIDSRFRHKEIIALERNSVERSTEFSMASKASIEMHVAMSTLAEGGVSPRNNNEYTIELRQSTSNTEEYSNTHYPPADRGKDAWLFLIACFLLEALVWGFPSIFGVFQDYYSTHEPFAGSKNIAVIGTCSLGIMYLELPLIFGILKAWPQLRRWSNLGGLLVMCLSLACGSFAQNVTQLIATQGVLFAVGGGFAWTPVLFYISEWFVQRLSFAYGVMMVSPMFICFFRRKHRALRNHRKLTNLIVYF
jgi:hypothetical protein